MERRSKISIPELEKFQGNLLGLSNALENCKQTVDNDLQNLGEYWKDDRYWEFYDAFEKDKERITEIIETFRNWANGYLERLKTAGESY
jgi:uncharacterized protein YukE